MLDIVTSYHRIQFQGKRMIQTQDNGQKPLFGPDLGQLDPNSGHQNFYTELVVRHCSKLSSYAIWRETYEPNLRKWQKTDRRTGRRTEGQTDGQVWFHMRLSDWTRASNNILFENQFGFSMEVKYRRRNIYQKELCLGKEYFILASRKKGAGLSKFLNFVNEHSFKWIF